MTSREPRITVNVDVTNPGQFFACCGLLELADRLWPGAEAWFQSSVFYISAAGDLAELWTLIADADLRAVDAGDETASPMRLETPFDLTLDWWKDEQAGGRGLKAWAGSMRAVRIARAMKAAIRHAAKHDRPFDYAAVVYDPYDATKKIEPFYFDARRGGSGLQRFRPAQSSQRRIFEYHTWRTPFPPSLGAVAVSGLEPLANGSGYRFENAFRTDQKKHKSFLPATPMENVR
jgi:hypothetical protein